MTPTGKKGTNMKKDMQDQQGANLKYWTNCWQTSNPLSEQMTETELATFWNKRSGDFAKKIHSPKSRKRSQDNIGFLEENGVRVKGAKILDIGCGPGSLSLPLARAGAKVTGIDISSGMLARLREAAEKEDLPVKTIECSWWNADIDKLGLRGKFDLVIGSMTPAIKDAETFERMMACSKKHCFYIGSLPGTGAPVTQDLLKNISRSPGPRRSALGMVFPFMYLYLKGHRPAIKITGRKWAEDLPWAEAAGHAIDILSHDQHVTDAAKKKIRAYYKTTAVDGTCRFENEMFLALMVWRVDR